MEWSWPPTAQHSDPQPDEVPMSRSSHKRAASKATAEQEPLKQGVASVEIRQTAIDVATVQINKSVVNNPNDDVDNEAPKDLSLPRKSSTCAVLGKNTDIALQFMYGINDAFLAELRRSGVPQSMPYITAAVRRTSLDEAVKQLVSIPYQGRCARSWHQFRRVRPLHLCASHTFVCFRENGDLVAVTQRCVLIYDRPPPACELSYKEPLYSIPVTDVSRAADLNDTSILMLRQGSYLVSDERDSDELLIAEVATNEIHRLAKIALPQLQRERVGQKAPDSPECRGMQVNKTEHKVYLLYDHHLAVIDLDMRLEPVVLRLRCKVDETGPAVALMEYDHAVYILTAKSWLLASNKTTLFSPDPGSCCLDALVVLEHSRLTAHEIRSYAIDKRHLAAFFSVPKDRKLVSLRFPVPTSQNLDFEAASAPLLDCLAMQERLYSAASCGNWAAAVPCALAWDATTEQLLVLEWGAENNGILISVDVFMEEGCFNTRRHQLEGPELLPVQDVFPIVKTFCRSVE